MATITDVEAVKGPHGGAWSRPIGPVVVAWRGRLSVGFSWSEGTQYEVHNGRITRGTPYERRDATDQQVLGADRVPNRRPSDRARLPDLGFVPS